MKLLSPVTVTLPLMGVAVSGLAPRLPNLPVNATSTATVTHTVRPSNSASSSSSSSSSTSTSTSPSVTFGPTPTSCDLRFCANGTSYCEYWGGYTSFDMSLRRPVPGETFTAFALCSGTTSANLSSVTLTTPVRTSTFSSNGTGSFTTSTRTGPVTITFGSGE